MSTLNVSQVVVGASPSNLAVKLDIPDNLRVVDLGESPPKGYHAFRVLTPEDGDKRIVWNADSLLEINDAKTMFDKLIAAGLVPYKVGTGGKATSEVMSEFDPAAEEVIFAPIGLAKGG